MNCEVVPVAYDGEKIQPLVLSFHAKPSRKNKVNDGDDESTSTTVDLSGQQNSTETIFTPPLTGNSEFRSPFLTSAERLEILKEKCRTEFANYKSKRCESASKYDIRNGYLIEPNSNIPLDCDPSLHSELPFDKPIWYGDWQSFNNFSQQYSVYIAQQSYFFIRS